MRKPDPSRTRVEVLMEYDSKTTQIMSNFGSSCGDESATIENFY